MATLYELTEAELQLMEMLEDGEMTDEEVEMWFDAAELNEEEYIKKVDAYGCVIAEGAHKADAFRAEAKRMLGKAEVIENNTSRLKARIEQSMRATNRKVVEGQHFKFSIQKNGGKQKLVVDDDPMFLPEAFQKWEVKVDTEALREYLETHPDCIFAHLEERGESLRIR